MQLILFFDGNTKSPCNWIDDSSRFSNHQDEMDYRFYNVLAGYGTRLCETKEELHQHRATEKVCEIKKAEGYRLDYFIFFRFISRFF